MADYGDKFATGVAMSDAQLAKAKRTIEASSMNEHALEAAGYAEEIVKLLTTDAKNRGLSPEQVVFAIALATINYRESAPEILGGKTMFDRVAHEAYLYYTANK